MSDISNQLIKDSFNYVLQSDTTTGVVYRIGGNVPVNPIFQSGLTVTGGFTYSGAGEQVGYALLTDGTGYAYWGPITGGTPQCVNYLTDDNGNFITDENGNLIISEDTTCYGVTSITAGFGLSANSTTGDVILINTLPDQTVTLTGGTNLQVVGTYPNFGINFTGSTTGGTVSGDYLPLSGGTVTGDTIFQSGLTATTISATTYFGIPEVTISGGTGITTGGTYPNFTIVNSAPDQTVTITGGTNIQITGTYPDFGINFTGSTTGGTVSGDYLPLSGGTVTGGTVFQSGLTANTFYSSGQVGIGTSSPDAAAILEIASTSQGVLFPRMTKVQRDAITSPPVGLILFVTDGDNEGLYIYKSTGWVQII